MRHRDWTFWTLQIPGWVLLVYLVIAQAIPAFDYELGVRMGTQESAEQITEVGAAFWSGFAVGDLLVYIPLLAAGLIGHLRQADWNAVVLASALAISAYWPVVVMAAALDARDAAGWHIDEAAYWIVLIPIEVWALWGLQHLARQQSRCVDTE